MLNFSIILWFSLYACGEFIRSELHDELAAVHRNTNTYDGVKTSSDNVTMSEVVSERALDRRILIENDYNHRKISIKPGLLQQLDSKNIQPKMDVYTGKRQNTGKVMPIINHPAKPQNIIWLLQWIENIFSGPEYFHIQVGAFSSDDEFDMFSTFLKTASWSKLMIEPQPHVFKKLKEYSKTVHNMPAVEAAICKQEPKARW